MCSERGVESDIANVMTLITRASIGNQQTLENFDFTFNPLINAKQVRELAICRFAGKGENIFFIGPTGTGKTHLTKGICHHACRINLTVAYYRFYELFNMLKYADLKNKLTQTMKQLTKVEILAIDDFAFKKLDTDHSGRISLDELLVG